MHEPRAGAIVIGRISPEEAQARGLTATTIDLDTDGSVVLTDRKAGVCWPRDTPENPLLPGQAGVGFGLGR